MRASFRFYGALNDFLPAAHRQATLVYGFERSASVKDFIETLRVPHPEIDRILVNGTFVDFAYIVRDGDRVAVYPPFRLLDCGEIGRLGPAPQADPRFVADVHLGRLTAYLRLAGFDTSYRNNYSDRELVEITVAEDRTVLTRDVGVLKHGKVIRGYFVRETESGRQLIEVLRRFDLVPHAAPFTRCLRCGCVLQVVPKDRVEHLLLRRTREYYDDFSQCSECGRVYWRGSHHARMQRFLDIAFAAATRAARVMSAGSRQ